jgi:Abnormal spindle-like microcephaly-assoc'd, ASPM-SPD-2-Hydin
VTGEGTDQHKTNAKVAAIAAIIVAVAGVITSPFYAPGLCRAARMCDAPVVGTTLKLSFSNSSFDPVQTGRASKPVDVTVTNPGTTSVSITTVRLSNSTDFTIVKQNCSDVPVPAGYGCTVTLDFVPQSEGPATTSLILVADGAGVPPPPEFRGTATAPGAISFSPANPFFNLTWSVGTKQTPTSQKQLITVRNTGSGPIKVKNITVDSTTHFKASDDCDNRLLLPQAPGCPLTVTFTQTGADPATATLIVIDDAGSESFLTLLGDRGYRPPIRFMPGMIGK